jgi:hypothetical protein
MRHRWFDGRRWIDWLSLLLAGIGTFANIFGAFGGPGGTGQTASGY